MTPGVAKPRSELPWLPYGEVKRVIVNAHNFAQWKYPSLRTTPPVLGYYARLDGGAAATDQFATDGANDGTVTSVTRTNIGGLAYTIGANGRIVTPDAAALNLTSGITVAAWIYPTAVGGGYRMIACKRVGGGPPSACNYQLCLHTTAGALEWFDMTERISSSVPTLNTWSHVAGTVTSGGRLDLWLNGVSIYNTTGVSRTANNGDFRVGSRPVDNTEVFSGSIDDVLVYPIALGATEIGYLASQRGAIYATP